MTVGAHVVTVTPASGGAAVDLSCLVDEVSLNHGRGDSDSQPDASSATVAMRLDSTTMELPAAVEVGALITVTTSGVTRFAGRITDIGLAWDSAGEDTPDRPVAEVIATSALADLGRRIVGDTPWPQQLDGARVAAIFAAAGVPLDPFTSDPGTVQVLPRDVDSQPALDVAREVAESAGGMVWETVTGAVRYADADHRRGIQPALTLDACDLLVSPTWRRTTEGLVNKVSIGYGEEPETGEGEQPRFVAERADSIARFGRYEFTASTLLARQADAQAMGTLLLTRNVAPVWIMADLPVDVAGLDAARTALLLGLDVHGLLTLTGLPAAGSAPTSAVLWVEGWSERLAHGEHELSLAVSGFCRTTPPPRWDDVAPEWTWDTITPASLTWDDATCLGPQPSRGRWADVSASLRWDRVPAATTWDTWQG